MIEGRLKAIVANLLGDWIESEKLDLSINIWNDENVRFENVNLKDSIIPVSWPFRLKAGLIGSLTMNIPFKTFGTTPAKITLSDVLVILSPRNQDDDEKAKVIDAMKEEKRAALEKDILERIHGPQIDKIHVSEDSSENEKKSAKKADAQESQGYYGANGFFGRLITRLMDNLHIEFKNVHIRFEGTDNLHDINRGPPGSGKYAVGFSIGALYAETTGSDWIPIPHNQDDPKSGNHVVFKLLQAKNLSAYVDPNALHFVHTSKHPRVLHATLSRLKAMTEMHTELRWWRSENESHTHRFVLAPFHISLKLTMNISKADKTKDTPHYSANFESSKLIAMLDDEQIVLFNRILDSFTVHSEWRDSIAQRLKIDEQEHCTTTLNEQYLKVWEDIHRLFSKQSKWEAVKASDAWKKLQTLEELVSVETAISMRNAAAFEDDNLTVDPDMSRSSLHDLGEAFGIPAPQINLKFQKGDLGLKMHLNEDLDAIVDECFAQAKSKIGLKPGLILAKMNGQPLKSLFHYRTVEELYTQMSTEARNASCVLTFRHPEVRISQVTPDQLISDVGLVVANIELRLVLSPLKQVVVAAVFQRVDLRILGYGPGWFSFHRYHLSAQHFYLQESVSSPHRNNCLISSVDKIKHPGEDMPVLVLDINFLEVNHPSVVLTDITTYANQYGLHLGDLIVVYEKSNVLACIKALSDFSNRAFPPTTIPPFSTSSTTSTSSVEQAPIRVRYDFSVHSLRVFVKSVAQRQRWTRAESITGKAPSNRSIFSQLTIHKAHATPGLQDWLREAFMLEKVTSAIIHLQKYVRGRNVRRYALPVPKMAKPLRLPVSDVIHSGLDSEQESYLYLHDYRLGNRRWHPFYFVLERTGVLRIFKRLPCTDEEYVDSVVMEDCIDVNMRLRSDEILAPHFPKPLYFLEIQFRTTKLVQSCNGNAKRSPFTDVHNYLVGSMDQATRNMWYSSLLAYKNKKFDSTKRILRSKKLGLRKVMMNPRDSYRGWLFRQDLTLAFRRWHEHFVYLDEYGQLRFYEDSTGRTFIDEEMVENINSVVHVGNIIEMVNWELPAQSNEEPTPSSVQSANVNHYGPAGEHESRVSYCIEITMMVNDENSKRKPQSFLLASYSFDDIADWRHILWEKRMICRHDQALRHLRSKSPSTKVSWPSWLRAHLGVHFTNTATPYENVKVMYAKMNSWISLYASQVTGTILIHEPPPSSGLTIEQGGAFSTDIRIGKLELRDRRSVRSHCVVYIGDTFLEFERGKLKAVAITSDQLHNNGQFLLNIKFRGPQLKSLFIGIPKPGLKIGVDFCGCILPNAFQTVLTDVLKELSPMWETKNPPSSPPRTDALLKAQTISVDIRVGIFEAYIEEKHCVAKFLMEGNNLSFTASTDREQFDLTLTSTSLHVMTTENQLRLAQVDGFRVQYELLMQSLNRTTAINVGQIKLEADGRMKILYQLFEALQLFEEEEDLEEYEDETTSIVLPSPMSSPALVAPAESMRPRHVRNESGVSIRSQKSMRLPRSHTGRYSEFHPTLSFIQPLLTYQAFIALLQKYNYSYWSGTRDLIEFKCENVVFEVVKRSLTLVALDTYIPVMKFSVSEICCQAKTSTEFKGDFEIDAKVVFLARYYNTSLADWEPVIEPWEVELSVAKPIGEATKEIPKPLSIDLRARHRLNLNFTEALVRLIVSVSKHHKANGFKNTERLLPSSETNERVNVINNLGVPIRLANLNTSNPGVLTIEVRDGWNLPNYTRFHDVKVDVVLLPWWSPRETSGELDSLNHVFRLQYGGANAGVAPKLRMSVSTKVLDKDHAVQLQLQGKELNGDESDINRRNTTAVARDSSATAGENWIWIGSVELNLAGNLMGLENSEAKRIKFCQWHRLRDHRGAVTGEVLVALQFSPNLPITKASTVQTVVSGGSLMVDPFRLGSGCVDVRDSTDGDSTLSVKLPESVRNGYVPPLALEVVVGDVPRSLLCPLQRAGKFFIKGEGVLAEVKVAQRDEYRRVLMLSSPKQVKNLTNLTVNIGTFPLAECEQFIIDEVPQPVSSRGRSISFPPAIKTESLVAVNPGRKFSLPLGALYSDAEYGVMLQVLDSKRTKIAELASLHDQVGCHILYLPPRNSDECGYCFFMEINSHVRNVYREEQYDTESTASDIISHDAKYQIRIHAGFVFENALPIRLKYKLAVNSSKVIAEGTLAPGDEVEFYHFHKYAYLYLCAPDEASSWSVPISLAKCISQQAVTISNQTISKADQPEQRRATETLDFFRESPVMNDLVNNRQHLFTARLDYTVADNGSPRTVIYSSVWIYNYSHVNDLFVRSSDNMSTMVACQTLNDQPKPRLMDCPNLVLELNTILNHEPGRWSERVHAGVVGVQKSVVLRGGQRTKHEVGVAIQRPLGQFHRTAQIIISSRYIVVNYTGLKFSMASEANGRGRNIEISEQAIETPFDYPGDLNLNGKSVCLKAGGGSDRNYMSSDRWSGMFSIEDEDEFPLWLPGAQVDEHDGSLSRVRVKVHTVGATVLIKLSKDDPPMLSIQNKTEKAVKLTQVNESESLIVPPNSTTTFAWECPDSPRKILCCMLMEQNQATGKWIMPTRSKMCDFDSLDSEEAVIWEDRRSRNHFAAEVKFDASSRVMVFRNAEYGDFRRSKFKLEVKVVAVRRDDHNPKEAFVSLHTDDLESQRQITSCTTIKNHGIYRFGDDLTFPCVTRPRQLYVELYEQEVSKSLHLDVDDHQPLSVTPDNASPRSTTFQRYPDAIDSSSQTTANAFESFDRPWGSPSSRTWADFQPLVLSSDVPLSSNSVGDAMVSPKQKQLVGSVDIKIPKKMWKQLRSTERKIGDLEGSWWSLIQNGAKVGKVQLAIKCTMVNQEKDDNQSYFCDGMAINMRLSSIGVSFVHNTNRLDVAYFTLQRLNVLYETHKGTSELAVSVGSIQMDNQIDKKVVLGPRGYKRKEGVSVRLRDRWRQCLNRKHRKLYEQFDISMLPVVQLRILYNDTCSAGSFHVELVELILQELEITTDEKFVVNLISVFQGLESLSSSESFDEVVDRRLNFSELDAKPITDGMYIEQLDVESIRVLFSLELNGGQHIATLGPSGRRLATYLPVSNVKDLRLYFSKLLFTHIYDSKSVIIDKLYRHYLQQALLVVIQGLYTVTLFVNPFRIIYRLGHGVLEVVRLPARGLASGSPVELLSGAYLGVRSLAMNTISASYEAVAGATGFVSSVVTPMIFNSDKKQKFQEEMVNFQRGVMAEVDGFDAAEEEHMTKVIVRAPRNFTGIGLLVEYGPGSLPMDEQSRVDLKAAVLIQNWWRRRRLVNALFNKANSLKTPEAQPAKSMWECLIM
ncbi:hypothetical protein LEN26_018645 [Aphanomyces euteiches]|nr:hypothetical protein LEN26_018645 [Aphanomyces euteiches]KAH9104861.1 hypothetical protein AeMF1_019204 [Aphanomyces euteiches]KAH9196654.1 hypothetical protein AeNC1_001379 [Aphanomyces euteiches]